MATTVKRRQSIEKSMAIIKGKEPQVTKENFRSDLISALNWYNSNWEPIDYQRAAVTYIKHMKMNDYLYAVQKATPLELRSIATIGRLSMSGQHIELEYMERMFAKLEDLKSTYIKPKAEPAKVDKAAIVVAPVSVQERMLEAARVHAAEFDGEIDNLFDVDFKSEFSAKSYLKGNQVSGPVAKKIGEFYKPLLNELQEAQTGKDADLKEGYSHITKIQLRRFIAFVEQIMADCNQQAVSAKAQRKPRARKVKAPSIIVKKMNYMKEFAPLKLKSISAEKIIGASELWVYNTTNRKLIVYYGADGGFLNVSGMSITNYDVAKSEVKTLRKPEEFFKGLTSTGKRAMANAWKAVKAKTSSPRARINDEMILVAAN